MSDPRTPQADQPTQEELQAYLEQLREADPAEVVAQAYTMLGTGAEVKLGRSDARVLIDAMAAMTEAVGDGVGQDLATRMRNGVVQLQTAQVQAEREAAGTASAEGAQGTPPPAQAPGAQRPADTGTGTAGRPAQEQSQGSPADRLWIPGREPR